MKSYKKKTWSKLTHNKSGFTLLETILSLVIVYGVFMGTMQLIKISHSAVMSKEKRNQSVGVENELRIIFSDSLQCEMNLKGLALKPNEAEGQSLSVYYFDKDGNRIGEAALEKDKNFGSLAIDDVRLIPGQKLSDTQYLADVETSLRTGAIMGWQIPAAKVAIRLTLDDQGKITTCSGQSMDSETLTEIEKSRACQVGAGNDTVQYNPEFDTCEEIYKYEKFEGSATWVECPTDDGFNWTVKDKYDAKNTCGNIDTECEIAGVTRKYTDGNDRDGHPPCVKTRAFSYPRDSEACKCSYLTETDLGPAIIHQKGQCTVWCKRPYTPEEMEAIRQALRDEVESEVPPRRGPLVKISSSQIKSTLI